MARNTMSYSLGAAAAATGLNKTSILRAIKSGKISGTKDALLTRANHRLAQPVTRAAHSSGRVAAGFRRIGFETSGKTERRFAAERAGGGSAQPGLGLKMG